MPKTFFVKASQPQHTPAGRLVGKLYYSGFLESTLKHDEYSGYPHNGGEHSLTLCMDMPDIEAFLDLVAERYGAHEGTADFIAQTRANASVAVARNRLH